MRNATIKAGDLGIYVNGNLFGIVASLQWEQNFNRRAIGGIDSVFPFELAPGQALINGQMSVFHLHNTAALEGIGLSPRDFVVGRERYFSLQVVDRVTDAVVLQIDRCAINTQSWSAEAIGVLRGSFTFMGIGWANEFGEN